MSRTVVAVVDDMFFASKIRATAEALAIEIAFPRNKELLLSGIAEKRPDLIVVDLHNQKIDALELVGQLKSMEEFASVPVLGFFSHVQMELQRSALAVGYDQVIPRSVFSKDLAHILTGE
jgi:PleD family two-component response regulator